MKKITLVIFSILLAFVSYSQSPNSFKYQTVIRDASGYVMANHDISLRMSILEGSMSGNEVYAEEHYVTTNEFGLVNINIGEGNTADDFYAIQWGYGPFFVKVEMDENAGSSFVELGVSQLLSVPYAMFANDVLNKDDADADPNNEMQTISLSNDDLTLSDGGSVSLSQYSSLWEQNGTNVYYNNGWVGVGTDTPSGKMVVQGDASVDPDSALFEVKNKDGQTIFAVYDGGVRIWVDDTGLKANTDKGGFAVGGYRNNKSISNEYLRVTPDSLRMYFDNQTTSGGGHAGGFSIQSFNGVTKTGNTGIMYLQEDNYFIGENSGVNLSTGIHNSTMGFESGEQLTLGNNNVFIGYQAGQKNTSGQNNNFIGNQAGQNTTTGLYNNFIGNTSGVTNTTGQQNNFMGDRSGYNNTTGNNNVFIGDDAGYSNIIGEANNFIGSAAGWSNDTGSYNNFIGFQTGYLNTSGNNNNFIGYQCGNNNTTGSGNNFIGFQAGYNNTTGGENEFMGYQAGYTNSLGKRNIFIGYHSGYSSNGLDLKDNVFIGDSAGYNNNSYSNIFIGNNAGMNNDAYENVYIGNKCGTYGTTGQYNTYVGTLSGVNSTGSLNSFFGNAAAENNTSGSYNAFFGIWAGHFNTEGSYNTVFGAMAGGSNTMGTDNTALGYGTNINGELSNSIVIGSNAVVNASNEAIIGGFGMTSIGGYVGWSDLSDKRFKTNVQNNVVGLDFILKLQPVTYNLDLNKLSEFAGSKEKINKEKEQIVYTGFLAQDVEKAAKELGYEFSGVDVPQNENDHYALRYATFVVPLVKAVQEQQDIIETQKTDIELLNEKLEQLTKRMELLESK